MTYRLPQVLTEFSFGIGMVNTEKIPKCSYQNTESVYNSSSPAHYQNQECEIRRKDLEIPPKMLIVGIVPQDQTLEDTLFGIFSVVWVCGV